MRWRAGGGASAASVLRLERVQLESVVGQQQEERLRVALSLQVLLQTRQAGFGQGVLASWVELHAGAEDHGQVLLVELAQSGLRLRLQNLDHLGVTGKT